MVNKREWVTPIVAGSFLVSAVTGVLLFFHMEPGLVKVAHTWMSWVFLGGVALHLAINSSGIKRCLGVRKGQWIIGLFGLILLLCFVPVGNNNSVPPFLPCIRALAQAPLTTVATVAQVSPEQLHKRLLQAGLTPQSDQQSVSDLVGQDLRKQMQILRILLANEE